MNKPVRELSQAEIDRLHPSEQAAIVCLAYDIESGRVHPGTSQLDLTPSQLATERRSMALARLTKGRI